MIIEPEFASTLAVMKRDGNTLSPIIRSGWDGRTKLQSLTKNSPNIATGAHVSIIGHITPDELVRDLDRASMANGFANRFLFVCVKRCQYLLFGGGLEEDVVFQLGEQVKAALEKGRAAGERRIMMTSECRQFWRTLYRQLSTDRHGLLGAITGRAEAQTIRLALVYALACGSEVIDAEHIRAALAVWRYCEASAAFIFGEEMTGDPDADVILHALRVAGSAGMTRTQIRDLLGRNRTTESINVSLNRLRRIGKVNSRTSESGPHGGRPTETWHAIEKGQSPMKV
jgi:hypothetical protein